MNAVKLGPAQAVIANCKTGGFGTLWLTTGPTGLCLDTQGTGNVRNYNPKGATGRTGATQLASTAPS